MRFVNALITFIITSAALSYMQAKGVVISDDAALISMTIMVAGALAGGD